MISEERIYAELRNVLESADFAGLGQVQRGKVRDCYQRDGKRIIVATDRISAFDCVLGTIPFKGQVLNQLAAFWFENTRHIAQNHLIDVPDPNIMIVSQCEQIPIEFVVRGYITGVTKTSAWYNYNHGVRNLCGNILPENLRKDQKLERPILTPTTKLEKHDRPISRDEAIAEGLIDAETFDAAAELCFKLYAYGVSHAASRGLILVDAKYEIGKLKQQLIVTDEIHTPDSSRYWFEDTYHELFTAGSEQRKLDKEYVRIWLAGKGFRGEGAPPILPIDIQVEAAKRYIKAYELITGREFLPGTKPVRERVDRVLKRLSLIL